MFTYRIGFSTVINIKVLDNKGFGGVVLMDFCKT